MSCEIVVSLHLLFYYYNENYYYYFLFRVMVLSDGRIVEFDSPGNLLRNQDGVFYKMALDAGLV